MTDKQEIARERLDEFDRDEWRDVALALKPDWTEAEFDDAWERFQEEKAAEMTRRGLQ